jgi:hypothetical protein
MGLFDLDESLRHHLTLVLTFYSFFLLKLIIEASRFSFLLLYESSIYFLISLFDLFIVQVFVFYPLIS